MNLSYVRFAVRLFHWTGAVQKNLEEGRGFKLNNVFDGPKGGVFDFASSNELWRASLDTIDFMPLLSVNYSGGIIVTDWYSSEESLSGESVKISIRFLTNEVRADALDIKVFNRKCNNVSNCIISEVNDELAPELKKQILKMWEGLGYYRRARNLYACSNQLINLYKGKLPKTLNEIKKLPGIGDYTGSALLGLVYDQPRVAVDGNVKRVFSFENNQ